MKAISFQRVLQFFRTKRIVENYEKLMMNNYHVTDVLGGSPSWCDFEGSDDWGECTSAFTCGNMAKFQQQSLYQLDIPKIEKEYSIKIDPASIPRDGDFSHATYPINISDSLKKILAKKLTSKYAFEKHGYLKKGILILGIAEPTFNGFHNDVELNRKCLNGLVEELESSFSNGCFREVIIVDELISFYADPENSTCRLFPKSVP